MRETEAEAVAYVVAKSIGLDPTTQSSDYIQLYSGDDQLLLQSLELIRKVASDILADLDSPIEEEVAHVAYPNACSPNFDRYFALGLVKLSTTYLAFLINMNSNSQKPKGCFWNCVIQR